MERGVVNKLTKKQRTFLSEYLKHGNATKAAEAAGYAWPDKVGFHLKRHRAIQAAIDEFFHEREMSAAEVVARLSEQGRAAYAAYLNSDGAVDLERLINDGKGHLIKGTKNTQHGLVVEFYDAQAALVQIGRYHGLFTDRAELTGKDGRPLQHEHGTIEEWKVERERRVREAAATIALFGDEDDEDSEDSDVDAED
jgi:phage terminase small subunit